MLGAPSTPLAAGRLLSLILPNTAPGLAKTRAAALPFAFAFAFARALAPPFALALGAIAPINGGETATYATWTFAHVHGAPHPLYLSFFSESSTFSASLVFSWEFRRRVLFLGVGVVRHPWTWSCWLKWWLRCLSSTCWPMAQSVLVGMSIRVYPNPPLLLTSSSPRGKRSEQGLRTSAPSSARGASRSSGASTTWQSLVSSYSLQQSPPWRVCEMRMLSPCVLCSPS